MRTTNKELKDRASNAGVRLWQIADKLGIADVTFSKWLRHELPQATKDRIITIIDQISQEADND